MAGGIKLNPSFEIVYPSTECDLIVLTDISNFCNFEY
jgi:hypothetical protein